MVLQAERAARKARDARAQPRNDDGTFGQAGTDERKSTLTGKASEEAAKIVGTSSKSVEDAARVKRDDPEEFGKVKSGQTTLGKGYSRHKNASGPGSVASTVAPGPNPCKEGLR